MPSPPKTRPDPDRNLTRACRSARGAPEADLAGIVQCCADARIRQGRLPWNLSLLGSRFYAGAGFRSKSHGQRPFALLEPTDVPRERPH